MKRNGGFTLMEVLVVIAIIVVLASFLAPAVNRANKQARKAECINNLRQIGVALQQYALDNGGNYPGGIGTLSSTPSATDPYLIASNVYKCPSATSNYALSGSNINIYNPANSVVSSCSVHSTNLYLDGHVQ